MANLALDELLSALGSDRPAVLVLGQDYMRGIESAKDLVLESFFARKKLSAPFTWNRLFEGEPLQEEDFAWLADRFDRSVPSEAVERVFELGWSAVFTTSIDQKIIQRLETRGRLIEAVLSKDHYARAVRSRARPAVHFLFGKATETLAEYRPPKTAVELMRRLSRHATPLLNRIAETATPLGVVVLDGFDPTSDWLSLDQLLATISSVPGPRVLWFGRSTNEANSAFVEQMEAEGTLLSDPRRLSAALAASPIEPQAAGVVFQAEVGTLSLPENRFLKLSPSIRLRTEAAAAVVDDTWVDEQASHHLDEFGLAESFRRFHGDFGGIRAVVDGVGRGFSIERDFEKDLFNSTHALLRKAGEIEAFVILHGQSGAGKSIALARLARRLRQAPLHIPVLFAWGRVPSAVDLDDFCEECERAGSYGTVILCDSNTSFERYRDLTLALKSRGRRIVVVGTSYKIEGGEFRKNTRFVEASETLSEKETEDLKVLLIRYGNQDVADLKPQRKGEHFLALLYRYLSASRERLAGGVSGEARHAEGTIRLRAKSIPRSVAPQKLLALKLIDAGLASGPVTIFEDDAEAAAAGADTAAKLVDFVMAAGRLDCPIPLNLLLRAFRAEDDSFNPLQIGYLFGELDLFRWKHGDPEGNSFLIQPRLQLEAELVCRRRMGDFEYELSCLLNLIGAVRRSSVDADIEVEFLLDLLHKLHRDGPRKHAYSAGYLRIGRALSDLRDKHQVLDARLMLQESAFRREALFAADKPGSEDESLFSDAERDQILDEAREVIEQALKMIAEGTLRAGRKAKQNFSVERASIYGYLAVGLAKRGADEAQIWPQYLAARTAVAQALSATNTFYPLDIGLWAPADIAQSASLSPEHQAELKADILAMLDRGNTDVLPPGAAERFQARKFRVAPLVKDAQLQDEAYKELEKLNPPVAYFLRARTICPEAFEDRTIPFPEIALPRASEAASLLEEHFGAIISDVRCLQQLVQLKWIEATGERIYKSERSPLPREASLRDRLLEVVSMLNNVAGEGARNIFRLLEASLEWTRGDAARARELFRSLAKDSEFEDSTRVIRRLLLESNTGGFKGRVERERSEGHWLLSVEGFSGTIDALSRDFPSEKLRSGRELRNFNIAFNYVGPIADPFVRGGRT